MNCAKPISTWKFAYVDEQNRISTWKLDNVDEQNRFSTWKFAYVDEQSRFSTWKLQYVDEQTGFSVWKLYDIRLHMHSNFTLLVIFYEFASIPFGYNYFQV